MRYHVKELPQREYDPEKAKFHLKKAGIEGHIFKLHVADLPYPGVVQIDIGFGDVIVPNPGTVSYPAILDFPAPELKGYTMESTIAEKFQAMVKLGVLNSRMKDFYDIWVLSRTFDFKGEILDEAIEKTFDKRNTPVNLDAALFNRSFGRDRDKNVQLSNLLKSLPN
jgi:hypothetical protein